MGGSGGGAAAAGGASARARRRNGDADRRCISIAGQQLGLRRFCLGAVLTDGKALWRKQRVSGGGGKVHLRGSGQWPFRRPSGSARGVRLFPRFTEPAMSAVTPGVTSRLRSGL
jgi:hypothetical protein